MNSLEMNNIEEIKTLNPYQQEAVLDESLACLVNANVGRRKDNSADREKCGICMRKSRFRMRKWQCLPLPTRRQMRSQNVYPEKKQSLRKKNCGDLEPFTVLP